MALDSFRDFINKRDYTAERSLLNGALCLSNVIKTFRYDVAFSDFAQRCLHFTIDLDINDDPQPFIKMTDICL